MEYTVLSVLPQNLRDVDVAILCVAYLLVFLMVCYVLLITGWSSLRQLLPLRIAQVAAVGVALRVDHV